MDEIAELRNALERLQSAMDDLIVRGVRSAGAADQARLTALRDEFRSAGAGRSAESTPFNAAVQTGRSSMRCSPG